MEYNDVAIKDTDVPLASSRIFQHLLKTYASEVNKLNSVWNEFAPDDWEGSDPTCSVAAASRK
jgi:hypothetical protein